MTQHASDMILAGDIGGTKALLEIGTVHNGAWQPAYSARYAVADHPDLHAMLRHFLTAWKSRNGTADAPPSACFGVAGPVLDGRAQMTNLPWVVDARGISAEFGIAQVRVVNDFAAAASGIEMLGEADLAVLQAGVPIATAPRLVLGAGTGLGVAFLIITECGCRVIAGEGGHAGFAPATPEQVELWRFLHARHGRVRIEDVVSGPGLLSIHEFVARSAGQPATAGITPAEITCAALESSDPLCLRALDLFIECYGEVAGNHALTVLARGGVYIAGGIAPRILGRLQRGGFVAAFNAKGSHSGVASSMPVAVVTNERLGLLGSALIASRA